MAGDWIKMRTDLANDPRVQSIAYAMNVDDVDLIVGKLWRLWSYVSEQTLDGIIRVSAPGVLDRILRCPGITQALLDIGWLEQLDGGLAVAKLHEHNSSTAKRRALEAQRKKQTRSAGAGPNRNPPAGGASSRGNRSRAAADTTGIPSGHDEKTKRTTGGSDADTMRTPSERNADTVRTPGGQDADAMRTQCGRGGGHDADTMRTQEQERELEAPSFPLPPSGGSPLSPPRNSRATQLSKSFVMTEERCNYAVSKGISIEEARRQFGAFCDYHLAKGSKFQDWDAAWRNWVRRIRQYGPRSQPQFRSTTAENQENVRRFLGLRRRNATGSSG